MKEIAGRVALVFAGVLLAWAMAEILIRVTARFRPDVEFIAKAGAGPLGRTYSSFEDFVAKLSPVHLRPHTASQNYYSNALGFMDREFSIEKPAGTRRIMALGDSFAFGSVGYPRNVLPLVEDQLRRTCGSDIEIMNFGIPGVGMTEYRWSHWLAAPRYKPDVVIVHYYMGNDGPAYVHGSVPRRSSIERSVLVHSYAWNYVKNTIRIFQSVHHRTRTDPPVVTASNAAADGAPKGGRRAGAAPDLADRDFEPSFTEEAFADIEIKELGQLYNDESAPAYSQGWKIILQLFDAIKYEVVASTGRGPIIVLYPSELQVYPHVFDAVKRRAAQRHQGFPSQSFDPMAPNRVLLDYCRREGLSCHDLTPAMAAAARQSPEPLYRPRDTHWNVRGNRVAAAAEAEFLQGELCRARP